MKRKWNIIYYETVKGKCEVQEFIASRKDREQAKILSWLSILEQRGPTLPRPYADLLEDGIHELRIKLTGDQVRILYFFSYQEFIIVTHSFMKTTKKVPKSEIEKAKKLRDDFLKRFDEQKIRSQLNENI
jgi:phage-related protein